MKEIKILHLYSRLLSLYGEYGNADYLAKVLTDNGHAVTVDKAESIPADLSGYDLVYTGAGTEADVMVAAEDIKKGGAADYIAKGGLWLATGNSMALLGGEIKYGTLTAKGLGAVNFATKMSRDKRWLGDALTDDSNLFGGQIIGYVNSSSVYEGIEDSLLNFVLGAGLGNDKVGGGDGFAYKGVIATQLTGPLLVKNPAALKFFYEKLTGEAIEIEADHPQQMAYDNALKQLSARI